MGDRQTIKCPGDGWPAVGFRAESGRLIRDAHGADFVPAEMKGHLTGGKHRAAISAGHMFRVAVRDPQLAAGINGACHREGPVPAAPWKLRADPCKQLRGIRRPANRGAAAKVTQPVWTNEGV